MVIKSRCCSARQDFYIVFFFCLKQSQDYNLPPPHPPAAPLYPNMSQGPPSHIQDSLLLVSLTPDLWFLPQKRHKYCNVSSMAVILEVQNNELFA